MPIHDWNPVDANLFHDFHQTWAISIRNALNRAIPMFSILLHMQC